jgi:hypothetical protein
MPQLIYSPGAKFCGKGQDAPAKQVCFTGKDARTEAGQPVVAAAPADPKVFEEQQKKLQDELQKRADEARKKLEGQGAAAPTR